MADHLRAVQDAEDDAIDWCLYCGKPLTFQAVSGRWVHEVTTFARCDQLNPLDRREAMPAPDAAWR